MSHNTAIEIKNLTQTFMTSKEEVIAISETSFNILKGEFVVVVGPSGCGKSTLLSILAGLYPITYGEIIVFGQKLSKASTKTAYMLQQDGLLEWRSIEQNILLGLEIRGLLTEKHIEHAFNLLKQIGLSHTKDYFPSQLSGGMRQRIALVRTLSLNPEILLLDEPFSALDIQNKIHLEDLVFKLLEKDRKTVLLVTHDLEEAIALGDRIIVMGGQPGTLRKIVKIPEEIRTLPPLAARGHNRFRQFFNLLWEEVERE